jgi:hypothetical protein
MFTKLKQSFRKLKNDPDVQELKENTAAMLRHELRRLAQKAKARAQREVPIEQFDASAR